MHDWRGKQVALDHLTDAQRAALDGGSPMLQRPDMWGSTFLLPPQSVVAPSPTQHQSYIDIGPFDRPYEIILSVDVPPGSPGPIDIEARASIGIGRATIQQLWTASSILDRVVVAQSLRVGIRRVDATAGNVQFSAWAAFREAGIRAEQQLAPLPGLPTVFASTVVVFGAGVSSMAVVPPAGATWIQVARDSATTGLLLRQTVAGLTFIVTLLGAGSESVLIALDPTATATTLFRSPFVLASNELPKWLS
jgi:hypothetical protein